MSTNISPDHISAFEALTSGRFANFALFSCFVNGTPAAAIVSVTRTDDPNSEVQITPLFVSVTDTMVVTDHEGVPA